MSKLFYKVLMSYILGGLFGLVFGYIVFVVINRFTDNIHIEAFSATWVGGVFGSFIGYGVGLYRERHLFAAAPDIEGLKVLGIGAFCGFLLIATFFATQLAKTHSIFVNDVRQVSNEPVVEIVFSTARPYFKPLARIRDPNFVKSFVDKLATAEIHSPRHDSHFSEGHVTLILKDGRKLEWDWYTPERDHTEAVLNNRAKVPGLGSVLTDIVRYKL